MNDGDPGAAGDESTCSPGSVSCTLTARSPCVSGRVCEYVCVCELGEESSERVTSPALLQPRPLLLLLLLLAGSPGARLM